MSSPQLQTPAVVGAAEHQPFYIPATDSPMRPRRTLKHGDTFAVLDSHGDIGISAGGADGTPYNADQVKNERSLYS